MVIGIFIVYSVMELYRPYFAADIYPTGRWLVGVKAEKHGLIEEPLMGAIFELVARLTAGTATNSVRV